MQAYGSTKPEDKDNNIAVLIMHCIHVSDSLSSLQGMGYPDWPDDK